MQQVERKAVLALRGIWEVEKSNEVHGNGIIDTGMTYEDWVAILTIPVASDGKPMLEEIKMRCMIPNNGYMGRLRYTETCEVNELLHMTIMTIRYMSRADATADPRQCC